MKLWLDDERPAPKGWLPIRWPQDMTVVLETNNVEEISLDHDLGDDDTGTGYDVLLWIEEQVFTNPSFVLPKVNIHTANPAARIRMEAALEHIMEKYSARDFQVS